MESIGARLRQTRESKGYTLEQIARDTHIAKRFLDALENEDFDQFPGEPYLIGFLRTYSEYLGLSAQEMVGLYRNLQLQEQPAPMDELIVRKSSAPVGLIVGIVAAVLVVAGGIYLLVKSGVFSSTPQENQEESAPPVVGQTYNLAAEMVEDSFSEGDRILVPVGDASYPIDLSGVSDVLSISVGGQTLEVPTATETPVDVDGDSSSDVRITVRSLNATSSPRSVVMRLDRGLPAEPEQPAAEEPSEPSVATVDTPVVGSTSEASRQETARLIAEFPEPEEFSVEVRFSANCLFRYEADDQERVEQYFQGGQMLVTSAQQVFRMWATNADAARLRVAGQDISLGRPGEVTAAMIAWSSSPDSQNARLELIPVF
jgi:cytoskeleton protein RodZ